MTAGKAIALTRRTFVGKVTSLFLNMLSRLVITFLPRSKRLLISWLQSPFVVILEPRKIKSDIVSTVSPSISHEVMEPDATIFIFWMLSFKPTFSLSSFTFIKRLFPRSALQVDSSPAEPQGKPKNTGVGSLSLLQGIFLTQELNQGLLHCRWILYQLSYQGSQLSS